MSLVLLLSATVDDANRERIDVVEFLGHELHRIVTPRNLAGVRGETAEHFRCGDTFYGLDDATQARMLRAIAPCFATTCAACTAEIDERLTDLREAVER